MTFVRTPPPKAPAAFSFADAVDDLGDAPSVSDEALDELAALFLTPSESEPHGVAPDVATAAVTELLLPGHLPVRGNLWLTPYADAVAQMHGSCTLLRMDDTDEFSVQVIRGGESQATCPNATVREVIEQFSGSTKVWIIRPTLPLNFLDLVTAGADRLTILTGTDGISVVAAYQLIKDLATAAADAGVTLPQLAVAVVGVDEEAAREMVRRINLTASSFLETDVQLRLCLPRIDAMPPCTQHITFSGVPCPDVIELASWIKQTRRDRNGSVSHRHRAAQSPMPEQQQRDVQVPVPQRNGNAGASLKLAPKAASDERSAAAADHQGRSTAPSPSLTQHIAGLTPLRPRCPGYDMIELAVDASGRLNLIGRDRDLRHLRSVDAWAKAHRELLAMACAELAAESSAEPICHVVTDSPASVCDLHSTGLRLHVLAPVQVNGQTAWYAAPLN